MTNIEFIIENMKTADLAAVLAKEAKELSAVAEKLSEVLKNPEFYPQTIAESYDALYHDLADVRIVSKMLGVEPDIGLIAMKTDAWAKRLGYAPEDAK